jgi:molybdopterin synthase catalytic subunit
MKVCVQETDFDLSVEVNSMRKDPRIGAIASFVGVVRDVAMTLEHYPGMTQKALEKIVDEAKGRWQVLDCTVIHRYGPLKPTDQIVMVAVASPHRGDAFQACEFIMDYLKTQAPFWKKEEGKGWVDARASDDVAAERWQAAPRPGKP